MRELWRHWQARPPAIDPRDVGLTFIDVLFALVMQQVIMPFSSAQKPPAAGVVQLGLAGVITITSWIGYHNSWNRPRWFIRFPNLPLWQFLLDVLLVIDYWLLAASAQGTPGAWSSSSTPLPACLLVTVAFALYTLWDTLSLLIRRDPRYYAATASNDVPARRWVTRICFAGSVALLLVFGVFHRRSGATTVAVLIALTVLTIAYRVMKDWFFVLDRDDELTREITLQLSRWDQQRHFAELQDELHRRLPALPDDQKEEAQTLVGKIAEWRAHHPFYEELVPTGDATRDRPEAEPAGEVPPTPVT